MDLLAYISYSSKSYSSKKSGSSSNTESTIVGVVLALFFAALIIVLIVIDTSRKKQAEEQQRKERQARWEAERKQREAEEVRKKAEEGSRKKEEIRRKQEQERLRRQIAQAEFERRKATIDKRLEREIVEVDESYSKLYNFQKQALSDLFTRNKKFCILPTGAGKTAVMFNWLKYMNAKKVLIVTTASKRDSGDFENEADIWCGAGWKRSLVSFEVISWHGLNKWRQNHYSDIREYTFAFDEVHNASGENSQMGKAFRNIALRTDSWSCYTATPGDEWKKFASYFIATGKIPNYVNFERRFTIKQFGQGYAFIASYVHTEELEEMWRDISITPDAASVFEELPEEIEETVHFERPAGYESIVRTHISDDGVKLDSIMALCHTLRQKCCTKQKLNWISDYVSGLETNAVFFYNYIVEGDLIVESLKKNMPKDAKIWRIDGRHHDIPTKNTLGPHDMVVAQYTSGSNSLNLQFIHYWVSFSPNYSYTLSIQAKGRIKRIGQQHTMFFYYFQTDNTIEDAIYNCLLKKEDFSEKVWAVEEGVTNEELENGT